MSTPLGLKVAVKQDDQPPISPDLEMRAYHKRSFSVAMMDNAADTAAEAYIALNAIDKINYNVEASAFVRWEREVRDTLKWFDLWEYIDPGAPPSDAAISIEDQSKWA